jgi:hypothetical protein
MELLERGEALAALTEARDVAARGDGRLAVVIGGGYPSSAACLPR